MSSYHGWTHRPKAQGGTDPVTVEAGSTVVPRAVRTMGNNPVTLDSGSTTPFNADDNIIWTSYQENAAGAAYFGDFTGTNGLKGISVLSTGIYDVIALIRVQPTGASTTVPPYILFLVTIASGDFSTTSSWSALGASWTPPFYHHESAALALTPADGEGIQGFMILGGVANYVNSGTNFNISCRIISSSGAADWRYNLANLEIRRIGDYEALA